MKSRDIKKLTTGTEDKCEGLSQKEEQKDKERKQEKKQQQYQQTLGRGTLNE